MLELLLLLAATVVVSLRARNVIRETLFKRQLRREGVLTDALIVNLSSEDLYFRHGGDSRIPSSYHFVTYIFIPDGQSADENTIIGKQAIKWRHYEALKAEMTVPIRYLLSTPQRSRLADENLDYAELDGLINFVYLGIFLFVVAVLFVR